MKSASRLPNTRKALAIAEFARDQGKLDKFRTLVMEAHWKDGKDIEDDATLREIATQAGLDAEAALASSKDPEYLKRVDERRAEFKQVPTGGVPTFVIGDEVIEGCKPYEIIAESLVRVGTTPK